MRQSSEAQLNELILQLNPEYTDAGRKRVVEAAEQLLDPLDPKLRRYRFFVLNSEVPNVFSHPGGYVYVTRELLDMIPIDEPHLLEFVLGHEIAHVERHHALLCLNAPNVRKLDGGTLQKLYLWIIPCGYPEEFEYEADAWVYLRMKQLGRTERECLHFLRMLDKYASQPEHGFGNGFGKPEDLLKRQAKDPKAERAYSPIDNHLRSHPAPFERLKRLRKLRDELTR